jgi:tryptophanyl-tRNA synthetase
MGKSYGNTIPLFGTKDEIAKAVMSIVTDSTGDRPENVHAIHKHFRSGADLDALYATHAGKYKNLKEALIEDIEELIAPMREVRNAITDDDVRSILREGAARAHSRAAAKMQLVRERVGVTI